MSDKVLKLHQQAEVLREQDRHEEALLLYEQVIVSYQRGGNYQGMVEALMGRCLTYKHLFLLSKDPAFAVIAKHAALSSLEIAKSQNLKDKIYRCHFWLGEMEMLIENYTGAMEYYKMAFDDYPKDEAEKGVYEYHLGGAMYRNGDAEQGRKGILEGIKRIEKYENETDPFEFNVWLSGGYKTLAELIWDSSPIEAKEYLNKAEQIIESDNRLVIRKRQLEELKQKLGLKTT